MKRFSVTPTKFLKRFLPQAKFFNRYASLRFINNVINPNIWHLNRRSVSGGLWVGIFLACQPIPLQMPLAAICAIWMRVNLPIAAVSTWLTNPVTFYPIFYLNFSIGCFLLGIDGTWSANVFSWSAVFQETSRLLLPMLVGSLFMGLVMATTAYWLVRLIWRWYVVHRWDCRLDREKKGPGKQMPPSTHDAAESVHRP